MSTAAASSVARPGPALLVLALGTVLSLILLLLLQYRDEERRREELRELARERVEVLRTQVLRSLEALHGIAALYTARGGEVSRAEFQRFVAGALARQPEIQGLAWDARVQQAERAAFEERVQAEGLAHFHVTDEHAPGAALPSPQRAEYFPVTYLEPLDRNAEAIGFDVASEPRRRAALESARDSGLATATAPVRLAQEKGSQIGFLVFEPLYRGRPGAVAERRAALTGFAVAVFRLGDLVEASLRGARMSGTALSLVDEATGTPLFGQAPPPGAAAYAHTETLEIADRRWQLHLSAGPAWGARAWPPWAAFSAGLAMTAMLAGHLWTSQRSAAELTRANRALIDEVAVRKRAEAAAEAANRAQSEFLANMSHEIRTPLNAILGYAQILARNAELHPFQRDAIATIAKSGDHLLHLIDEILDLSKIDAGRMEVSAGELDLARLLRDLLAMFQLPCEEKRLGLVLAGQPAEGARPVLGDEGKLRQVLINLLGNAVKFTERGRVTLRVEPAGEGEWQFSVEDTGPGIPAELQAAVFQSFTRGPAVQGQGGAGLGLAIARRQVELMGGTLLVDSARGQGARFHFTLPLPPAPARADSPRPPLPEVERLAPGCQVRAVVVDDIPENREVLALMLESIGCEVRTAAGGEGALAAIREAQPEIVFIDLRLPAQEGGPMVRQIFEEAGTGRLKVVATSASAVTAEQAAFLQAGCDDFVAKPFRAERIYACLQNLLGVEFVLRVPAGSLAEETIDLTSLTLPEDLVTRLTMAAELHSATVLKNCLGEVAALGPAGERLAEHLRGFLASYDMATIQRLVAQLPVAPALEGTAK